MKAYERKRSLTSAELAVLQTLKKIGFKSTFQMADKLSDKYDILTVMRSLHTLMQMELLVRFNLQGERYYKLNEKNSSTIKLLLNQLTVNANTIVRQTRG